MFENTFIALVLFVIPLAISPGPNNVLLAASVARFGFKKTIPHILGIEVGFVLLILLGALGLGVLYAKYPLLPGIFKGIGALYLLYLSYGIWMGGKAELKPVSENTKPMSFGEAVLFQFVNPKAMVIVSSMLAGFSKSGDGFVGSILLILLMVPLVGVPCISLWAYGGAFLKNLMENAKLKQSIHGALALMTLFSIYFLF